VEKEGKKLIQIRLFFAILGCMEIGGYNKEPDWVKMGPSLLIASCLILAIRTAKWTAVVYPTASERPLEAEMDYAIHLADRMLCRLVGRKADLFPWKQVPWYVADDKDEPK
jgi:hypothetical protein